jgi:hypothetical protein
MIVSKPYALLILAVFFVLSAKTSAQDVRHGKPAEFITINFLDKRCTVFILDTRSLNEIKLEGKLSSETYFHEGNPRLITAGTGIVRFRNIVIVSTADDISINGRLLGQPCGAAVSADGVLYTRISPHFDAFSN